MLFIRIHIEESKQYGYIRGEYNVWELKIFITFNHKKYVVRKEYFKINGKVKGFRHRIFSKERDYP